VSGCPPDDPTGTRPLGSPRLVSLILPVLASTSMFRYSMRPIAPHAHFGQPDIGLSLDLDILQVRPTD